MPHYTCDPNIQVTGTAIIPLFTNLEHEQIQPVLEKHKLDQIDQSQWYPVQKMLDVFSDISELPGSMFNFVAIGMAATEYGYDNLPPEMKTMSLDALLLTYSRIWQQRHRNTTSEMIKTEMVDPHHIRITVTTPYPDDLMYGIFYAYARKLLKTPFTVKYDDNVVRRDEGGEVTVIHINWE